MEQATAEGDPPAAGCIGAAADSPLVGGSTAASAEAVPDEDEDMAPPAMTPSQLHRSGLGLSQAEQTARVKEARRQAQRTSPVEWVNVASMLAIPVEERNISLAEVYSACEAFTTGTMGALVPVSEIDGRGMTEPVGVVTQRLQEGYLQRATSKGVPIPRKRT